MHKCDGCFSKFYKSEIELDEDEILENNYFYIEYFKSGKWDWVCDHTKANRRTFKNCPCYSCIIKPVCNDPCEEFYEILKKYGIR